MSDQADAQVVNVNGTPISLLRAGSGPPLVVLHAAGGAGTWLPYQQKLAEHFTVIAPDAPGFGRSPEDERIEGVDDLAFLYLELIEQLGLRDPMLLGASFGGWVAAEVALLGRELISRLVLVDPIGLRIPEQPIGDLFAMDPPRKMAALFHDPAAAARIFPNQPDLDTIVSFYRDETAFARYAWSPFCCNPKLPRRLHRILAPTLVLWGENDRLVPRAHGERYVDLIPDARLEIIANAGHAVMLETPDAAVAAIRRFLAG